MMARIARPLLTTALALGLAAPAAAQFSPAQQIALPPSGQLAAAVGPGGQAVVATVVSNGPTAERVRVAARRGPGAPWVRTQLGGTAVEARDVQAVAAPAARMLVVWAHVTRSSNRLRVALTQGSGARTIQSIAVRSAWSASPRLVVARSGSVVLAYRDAGAVLVRVLRPGAARFGAAHLVGFDAASIAVAAAGDGAVVAWPTRFRKGPRPAFSRRLAADGRPLEPAQIVSRDAGGTLRLGGAGTGRSVASWVRPARDGRRRAAFTRSLQPVARPARPLGGPGIQPREPASLALRGERALAALGAFGADPFGFRVLVARSLSGGVWTGARELGPPSAMGGSPRPVLLPGDRELVVWTTARAQAGAAVYEVRATTAQGTAVLGTTTAGDGRGFVVAQSEGRVLVAWRAPGGLRVADLG